MIRKPSSKALYRYLASLSSEKEKARIEAWINADLRNKEFFDELRKLWETSFSNSKVWNYDDLLERLTPKLKKPDQSDSTEERFRLYRIEGHARKASVPIKSFLRIAAAIIAVIGSLYLVIHLKEFEAGKNGLVHDQAALVEKAITKHGQQVTLEFGDGTRVVLNSISTLKYTTDRDGVRNFYLEGEAFFQVVDSKQHPLIVHVNDGTIRDVGTEFDVKSWLGDMDTRVTVVKGIVSIQPHGINSQKVLVRSHQYSVISKNSVVVPPTYTEAERAIEWMKGEHVFYNDPMREVLKQIWRTYGINSFVSDTSILSRKITTSFDNRDPARRILDLIAISQNLRYKISGDSVLFMPADPDSGYFPKPYLKDFSTDDSSH